MKRRHDKLRKNKTKKANAAAGRLTENHHAVITSSDLVDVVEELYRLFRVLVDVESSVAHRLQSVAARLERRQLHISTHHQWPMHTDSHTQITPPVVSATATVTGKQQVH